MWSKVSRLTRVSVPPPARVTVAGRELQRAPIDDQRGRSGGGHGGCARTRRPRRERRARRHQGQDDAGHRPARPRGRPACGHPVSVHAPGGDMTSPVGWMFLPRAGDAVECATGAESMGFILHVQGDAHAIAQHSSHGRRGSLRGHPGSGTAPGAHRCDGPDRPAEAGAIQSITIKVAKQAITVRGAKGLDAGRVKVDGQGRRRRRDREVRPWLRGPRVQEGPRGRQKGDIKALKRHRPERGVPRRVRARRQRHRRPAEGRRIHGVLLRVSRPGPLPGGAVEEAPTPDVDGKIVGQDGPEVGRLERHAGQGHVQVQERRQDHAALRDPPAGPRGHHDRPGPDVPADRGGPPPFLEGSLETGSLSPGAR